MGIFCGHPGMALPLAALARSEWDPGPRARLSILKIRNPAQAGARGVALSRAAGVRELAGGAGWGAGGP